jgi:hypothetical protein
MIDFSGIFRFSFFCWVSWDSVCCVLCRFNGMIITGGLRGLLSGSSSSNNYHHHLVLWNSSASVAAAVVSAPPKLLFGGRLLDSSTLFLGVSSSLSSSSSRPASFRAKRKKLRGNVEVRRQTGSYKDSGNLRSTGAAPSLGIARAVSLGKDINRFPPRLDSVAAAVAGGDDGVPYLSASHCVLRGLASQWM